MRIGGLEPIDLLRELRLAAQVHELRHSGLHAEGELIGLDHSVNSTLISLLFLQVTVHLLNEIDLASLQVPGKAVAPQILQVCVLDRAGQREGASQI